MPKQKENIETEIPACPLCGRPVPSYDLLSDHYLVSRNCGGKKTEAICVDCHKQIHAMCGNKRLEDELGSVEVLLADPKFAKFAPGSPNDLSDRWPRSGGLATAAGAEGADDGRRECSVYRILRGMPFAKWQGYYYPVEMWCECPGTPRDQAVVVFSRACGW